MRTVICTWVSYILYWSQAWEARQAKTYGWLVGEVQAVVLATKPPQCAIMICNWYHILNINTVLHLQKCWVHWGNVVVWDSMNSLDGFFLGIDICILHSTNSLYMKGIQANSLLNFLWALMAHLICLYRAKIACVMFFRSWRDSWRIMMLKETRILDDFAWYPMGIDMSKR